TPYWTVLIAAATRVGTAMTISAIAQYALIAPLELRLAPIDPTDIAIAYIAKRLATALLDSTFPFINPLLCSQRSLGRTRSAYPSALRYLFVMNRSFMGARRW